MKTSFAEIDALVSEACEREFRSPTVSRDGLKEKATKAIAGFHIYDAAEEERLYQAGISDRKGHVAAFQHARDEVMVLCAASGITPLAIVPTPSWRAICDKTGLFRFAPDEQGQVIVDTRFMDNLKDAKAGFKTITIADQVEHIAKTDWPRYLLMLFPKRESPPIQAHGGFSYIDIGNGPMIAVGTARGYTAATLVLPTPPADVAEILLKAHGKMPLKVAAVADAVSFKKSPSQIVHHVTAQREAIQRALREDPIIYHETQHATAILAQFGDFPIERAVVERVLSAETALRFFPGNVNL